LRNLLDQARDQLAARDLTNALETLKPPKSLTPDPWRLRSLSESPPMPPVTADAQGGTGKG